MIKKFNLKLIVFLIACLYSTVLSAQINSSTAVVPFGANPGYGNGIMPTNLPTGGTYGKSQDAADAYIEWRNNYTESCGGGMYRVKFDEPNRTVSEGIGYGMQLAAYAADKVLFDGLYAYWKNFKSPASNSKTGKLMNWRIEGCGPTVSGTGSAADADVDAVWALLIAENQWPTVTSPYDYASEATNMLYAIKELELNSAGQLINGDGWGFGDNCRNPGYQSPAYYPFFATNNTAYAGNWTGAITSAYTLLNANADATTGLISDWSNPSGVRNTCNPGGLGYAATDGYGYDACRNPWRMAQDVIWNNSASGKTFCTKIAAYLNGRGSPSNVGGPLYQNGSNYAGYAHNATFVATFATAVMGSTNQTLMNSMYTETKNTKDVIKNTTLSGYFGNTLRCVALFMMSGNYWKPGTSSLQEINVRKATTTTNILTGTTYDFQNEKTGTTGKVGTFTIENLGFATLNLNGSSRVVLSGANASDFILSQPSSGTLALGQTTDFTVTFKPATVGAKMATLTIASNDPDENPYIINLIGTGTLLATSPKISIFDGETLTAVSNNGTIAMGTSSAGSVDVRRIGIVNSGDAALNLASFTAAGTGYTVVTVPAAPTLVAINDTGYVYVQVTSAVAGTPTGSLTIASDDNANASFKINFTSSFVACGTAVTTNEVYQDFEANYKNTILAYTLTGYTELFDNPHIDAKNPSTKVAQLNRLGAGYQGPRYTFCGTGAVNLTAAKFVVSMLIYSPASGVPVQMNLKTAADVANTTTYPSRSSVTVVTTKANQWERLYFNHTSAIGVASITNIEVYVNPTDPPALPTTATYLIDDIRLDASPCLTDNSGVIQDFDDHNNSTLAYSVAGYTPGAPTAGRTTPTPVIPSVVGGLNTSPNAGYFVKSAATVDYGDGIRYVGCGGKMDFSTKKYVSFLVYSSVANAKINLSPKIGATDVLVQTPTTLTVFANKWHRVYFDLSAIPAASIPNITGLDIFFDPLNDLGAQTYWFDDLRYESTLPCVAGIDATDILNDFEDNRYLGLAFPGEAPVTAGDTYFSTVATNPSATGLNTSAVVGKFLRGKASSGTSFRFTACQSKLDLSPGRAIIDLKMYSPNPKVAVVMSLKNAAGTSLSDVTDTIFTANTWTNLRFDHSKLLNSTAITSIDIIVDGAVVFSGAASTDAARTYYVDDLRYALPAPEINIQANTSPAATDIPTKGSFNMGTAAVGDSTLMDFKIQNNGLQTLTLTGTGAASLVLGGANPGDFIITTTQTFTTSISSLSATGFSVKFKPTASGARSASITVINNDANESPYIIYLNGTATVSVIKVLDGGLVTSPIILNNNTPAINVGTSAVGVAASAYTMSIRNTGTAPLKVTSVTPSTGFTVTSLTPTGDIAAGAIATFTVTGTPQTTGVNAGTLTIVSNDPATPSYKVNITVTGSVPVISVQDATATLVANNNTTPVSVGTSPVGVAATPAYIFTIKNTGSAPLTITSVTPTTGFTVTAVTPTGAIAPAGSATFTVTGTPAIAGVNTGSVTIVSNDPVTGSYKVNVSVTGTTATAQVLDGTTIIANNNTPAVALPSPVVNTPSVAKTFTIKNNGTAPLTVGTISASTGFTVTQVSPAGSIAGGATATFTVSGTPTSTTVATTGAITIPSNDPATPYVVNVSVIGTAAPTAAVQVLDGTTVIANNNTPAVALPSPVVNTPSADKTFTIKNTGTAALTVGTITASTGFTVTQVSPAGSIAAGATATFTVSGTPTSTTVATTGAITIPSNDPATPYVVNVSVIGTAAPTAAVQVLDGTTIIANNNTPAVALPSPVVNTASADKTFTIKNTGTAALTVGTISASTGFTVTQVSPAGSIAAGATATFTVSGTPTSTTVATTGAITIPSNDPATPYVVNVSVIGTAAPTAAVQVLDGTTIIANNNTPAVALPSAVVNTPSADKTFTIKNTGTAALTVGTITASTGFTVTQVSPAGSIAAGATATFTVSGTPTSTTVATTGAITIPSNDPATPYVVNVSVIGTAAPTAAVQVLDGTTIIANNNTPAVALPSPVVNTPSADKTFTIKNTGTAALTVGTITASTGFTVTQVSPAGSIAAGATATFTVSGTPTSTTVATTGAITIPSDDPATPYVVNVSVIGTASPTAAVQVLDGTTIVPNNNTTAVTLPSASVNTASTPKTITIKNTGTAALNVSSVTASTGFTVTAVSPAGSIAAGATATFTVSGTPTSTTVATTGTITIESNDPATPYVVNVSVIGTAAPTAAVQVLDGTTIIANNNTPAVALPSAVVNTASAAKTFTIKNTGTAALTVGTISASTGFTVTQVSPAGSIAAGATATFTVSGTPTSTTATTGVITIPSNDPATPYIVNVSVTGTAAPQATVTIPGVTNNGPAVSIGSAVVGNPTAPYTFTISNTGSLPLNVGTITSSNPEFVVTQVSPNPIPAGGTGTFTVTATPSAIGTSTGAITIPSNDPSSPFVINVSATGTGTPTGPVLQLKGKSSQIVANNSSFIIGANFINTPTAPYTFTITNIGSGDLIITNIIATSGFSATQPSPATIAPGVSRTITVTGIPNNASATRYGTITILSNDASAPFTLNVGVDVGTPTGVRALSSTEIEMFPNPTTLGYSNIEFNGSFDDVVVTVYSADGSRALIKEFSSVVEATRQLDVEELPSGVYFVEVSTAQGKIVKRLIKQ